MELSLRGKISLDNSSLIAGMEQAKHAMMEGGKQIGEHYKEQFGQFGRQMLEVFAIEAIREAGKSLIEYGSHIVDLKNKTGLTVEEVQSLNYATKQTGASFDDAAGAIKKLAIAKQDALSGKGDKILDFKALGISMAQLREMRPAELFERIGTHLGTNVITSERFAAAISVMGKSADNLFPAFKEGLSKLKKDFEDLNATISEGTAQRLKELGDKMQDYEFKGKKAGATVMVTMDKVGEVMANVPKAFFGATLGRLFGADGTDAIARIREIITGSKVETDAVTSAQEGLLKKSQAKREERKAIERRKGPAFEHDSLAKIGGVMGNSGLGFGIHPALAHFGMMGHAATTRAAAHTDPKLQKIASAVDLLRIIADATKPGGYKNLGRAVAPGALPGL